MKTKAKTSYFKYYYTELYSHSGVTPHNKRAKKFLFMLSGMDVLLLLLVILLNTFKDSKFVYLFTSGSQLQHNIYSYMLSYACIAAISYTLYHIISYKYECKYKHELLSKDIKGVCKVLSIIYKIIHFPWILITCFFLKLLELFRITALKNFIPMIVAGYSYFLMLSLIVLQVACKTLDQLIDKYDFLTNSFITEKTYLYIIVLLTILLCKYIPTVFLKAVLKPTIPKNSMEYKRIFRQYHLLNYYFLVVITLFLKALHFNAEAQVLIDALFYTTNALALFSTAREKALNSQ